MSALTVARPGKSAGADGMARAARLMRALGPEAAPVWSELSTEEASALWSFASRPRAARGAGAAFLARPWMSS